MRRGAKYAWRERHPASSSSTSRDDEPPASVNRRGMSAVLLPRRRSRLRPGIVAVQIESNRDDRSGSWLCKNVRATERDRIEISQSLFGTYRDSQTSPISHHLRKIILVTFQFLRFYTARVIRVISGSRAACRLRPQSVSPFCVVERVNVPGALCRRGYVYGAPRLPAQRTVIESQSKRRLRFLAEVVSNFFWRVCFSFEPIVLFLENPSKCRTTYHEQR